MLKNHTAITQALLGTLLTWALTAAGAALVIIIRGKQRKLLDVSLGFAAGVMTAASYWSLLAPAIEMAAESKMYGAEGEYAFVPVAVGFLVGAAFVYGTDSPNVLLAMQSVGTKQRRKIIAKLKSDEDLDDDYDPLLNNVQIPGGKMYARVESTAIDGFYEQNSRRRQIPNINRSSESAEIGTVYEDPNNEVKNNQWRRILLLIVAITVHNIPEGLAVGVGFGAIGSSASATFENARNLAIGIGIQNFPEGLAVALPLQAAGISTLKSFWYGQLSGMVEPIAGVLGAAGVTLAAPALPYALAFAAGAMIYVVIDDIIPEAHQSGNGKLASWAAIVGFLVMMSLDVGLG
ncbi:S39AB protein, partial [Acromyrmex insinuator]